MPLRALFFDVGNTLLFPNRTRILSTLHAQGVFPCEELLYSTEREVKCKFDSLVESHASIDHGFWHLYYSRLLAQLDIKQTDLCHDLVARTRISRNWCDIRPGTREVLLRLGQAYRLGVISNADGKIAEALNHCGIADCFESIIDSGLVGAEKPDPTIFQAALASLRMPPDDSLYIGDLYSVDYLGATRVGMHSVLFDVTGTYRARGLPRVESLQELEQRLGIA
jgi:HAD superfamily hydrolase (TIGR01509 family)